MKLAMCPSLVSLIFINSVARRARVFVLTNRTSYLLTRSQLATLSLVLNLLVLNL